MPKIIERPQITRGVSEPVRLDSNQQLATAGINEEQKFNSQLQSEIDAINASLSRINSLVSQQKEKTLRSQQSCIEESHGTVSDDISMELRGTLPSVRVHDQVSSKLFKTMTHWNSMIKDLQESTDFDIDKVSMSFRGSTNSAVEQSMMLPLESSRSLAPSMAPSSALTNHSRGK